MLVYFNILNSSVGTVQFGFDKVIGARINFIIIIVIIDILRVTYAVKTIARTTVLEGR